MRISEPLRLSPSRVTSLSLDYGADDQECGENAVEISERGMKLRSRWQFSIGTQMAVAFDCPAGGARRRLLAEGIVVWCERCGELHESTLLFLELPEELRQGLQELSRRLEP